MRSFQSPFYGLPQDDAEASPRSVKIAHLGRASASLRKFVVNVQCALGFALAPEAHRRLTSSVVFQVAATQGIGIASPHVELHLPTRHLAPRAPPRPRWRHWLSKSWPDRRVAHPRHPARRPRPAGQQHRPLFIAFDAIGLVLAGCVHGAYFFCLKDARNMR